jgi:hypothetical protein
MLVDFLRKAFSEIFKKLSFTTQKVPKKSGSLQERFPNKMRENYFILKTAHL